MRRLIVKLALWMLSRLMPAVEREAILGDLMEEYTLRASASSSAAVSWLVRQVGASVPPLLWISLTRSAWLSTAGVALLAYSAVAAAELLVRWTIAISSAHPTPAYNPLSMAVTFPLVVLIGYGAATLRRRAPVVLGALMLVAVTLMTIAAKESVPAWYRAAYFVVGPAAVALGSLWHSWRPSRE